MFSVPTDTPRLECTDHVFGSCPDVCAMGIFVKACGLVQCIRLDPDEYT